MLKKIGLLTVVALGVCFGGAHVAQADNCYRPGHHHHHHSGYYSSYRPPVTYYNSYHSGWNAPVYRPYVGHPVPSTFSHGHTSYFGGNYGTGYAAPFGGYGVSGFPRSIGSGYGPGFSLYIGR